MNKKICVVGLGRIGLSIAVLLACKGYQVHGVDINPDVVDFLCGGKAHIQEPELDLFLAKALETCKFTISFSPDYADVFIIAVQTSFHEGLMPNMDCVFAAAKAIAPYIREKNLVILESTSPVGTTAQIEAIFRENNVDVSSIHIAYCPERVLPGKIMWELLENDRIVGGISPQASSIVADFYREFVHGDVLETDSSTAEMTKLAENSFRDVNIAFANELSILCDRFGIDIGELILLANRHPRVNILNPGCGVGGDCLPLASALIAYKGGDFARLIRMAREVNDSKFLWVIEKIKSVSLEFERINGVKPVIACMGLSFKPDVAELKNSMAFKIANHLHGLDLSLLFVEPNIEYHSQFSLTYYEDAVKKADILAFLVAHNQFKGISHPNILNFCGL